jgi:hypothetical protein
VCVCIGPGAVLSSLARPDALPLRRQTRGLELLRAAAKATGSSGAVQGAKEGDAEAAAALSVHLLGCAWPEVEALALRVGT